MAKTKKAPLVDPRSTKDIFAAYAKTAAREDVRWYVTYGMRKIAAYHLPARAIEVVGQMRRLLAVLELRDGGPADTKQVWQLVRAFKAAIPYYAYPFDSRGEARIKKRTRELTPTAVEALITAATPAPLPAPVVVAFRPRPVPVVGGRAKTAKVCPTCGQAIAKHVAKATLTPATGRGGVDWQAAGRKAWETRQRRLAEAAAAAAAATAAAPKRKRGTR